MRTHIGYGSPHKQDTFKAHGSPLGEEEVQLTKKHLGWPLNRPSTCQTRRLPISAWQSPRRQAEAQWQAKFFAYCAKIPGPR